MPDSRLSSKDVNLDDSWIGVGMAHWIVPLPPPNRTCGSPASGSPVEGSPPSGLTGGFIGFSHGEKPMLREKSVWPSLIVGAAGTSLFVTSFP